MGLAKWLTLNNANLIFGKGQRLMLGAVHLKSRKTRVLNPKVMGR